MKILANPNQKLDSHLLNIAELSYKIIQSLDFKDDDNNGVFLINDKENLSKIAYLAGLFHDIGKTDPIFQKYLFDKTTTDYKINGVHIEKDKKDEKFSFETHPRHSEISWAILEILFTNNILKINKNQFNILKNVVLWHHAAPFRVSEFKISDIISALSKNKEEFKENLVYIFNKIKSNPYMPIDMSITDESFEDIFEPNDKKICDYKYFYSINVKNKNLEDVKKDINSESAASLIRSVVITADRFVSANKDNVNTDRILNEIFESKKYSNLKDSITKMEKEFYPDSEQSLLQKNAANELNEKDGISILVAPAGAGKTKTALQWASYSNAEKIYYIVPRTIIGEEVYNELKTKYLKNAVSFELITGEQKLKWNGKKEIILEDDSNKYESDIIITTIDQIIKTITTHKDVSTLHDMIKSHLIFDEYHEYNKLSGFDMLFAEIIKIKSVLKRPNTLIMSATPNYFMLENFLGIYNSRSSRNNIVRLKTLNENDFTIKIMEYDEKESINKDIPLFIRDNNSDFILNKNDDIDRKLLNTNPFLKLWDDKKTIVISNTATMAQISYLINNDKENSMLSHSKYEKEDKINIFTKIKSNFSKIEDGINILRSGPIVQASLNITSERLITDLSSPENILQRLGRLNRFGSSNFVGEFIIAVPHQAFEIQKNKSSVLNHLRRNNELESSLSWVNFIRDRFHLENGQTTTFKLYQIYELYEEFYKIENNKDIMEEELINTLKYSFSNIEKNILNPMEMINKKNKKDNKKLSKNSLRGQSYYTNMAIYELNNNSLELQNDYKENISLGKDIILIYNNNYLFVEKTIKNCEILMKDIILNSKLKNAIKQTRNGTIDYRNQRVLEFARTEDFSVFTSMSKAHLNIRNFKVNDAKSIVYLKCEKQPIGYINLNKLIKIEE